ncbi:MAG: hypothetical protein K6G56_05580 [Clostridiales bacterium]|nr:hypothetical protein [Clostridiales bacterium]
MTRSETERPIPRSCTMDGAPAVHEYFSKEEVSRYEAFRPQTVEEAEEGPFDRKDLDNRMAVVLKGTGELIGTVDDAYKEDADGNPVTIRSGVYKYAAQTPVY